MKIFLSFHAEEGPGSFDPTSFALIAESLRLDGFEAYDNPRYPYPPAFMPWLLFATWDVPRELLPYDVWLRLPMIVADAVMATLVADFLWRREKGAGIVLTAAALIAAGPVFLAISGVHGQFDSVAMVFGVAAIWAWERGGSRRALQAGVLIGIGAAMKTIPIFLLLALIPWVRGRGEAARLIVPAVVIPAIAIAPFLLANGPDTVDSLRGNQGIAGFGGASLLLLQPSIREVWDGAGRELDCGFR